ncbi:MAG: heavy metal translocating P-type ATPase, partial [Rhodobacteraceae bacterium]|nr:heavy metal translocating P-type ATPase [Paracoccaceae bacterium]
MSAHSLNFPVSGLNCAGCVGRAETALKSVPGVVSADVNLATRTARVETADPAIAPALQSALEAAGYPARPRHMRIDIAGMSCGSCAARVEKALSTVSGVTQAHVNLASGAAELELLADSGADARVLQAVQEAGYTARMSGTGLPETTEVDSDGQEREALRRRTILAGALTLPVFVLEMGGHAVPALHHWIAGTIGTQTSWILQFVLITAVLAGPGRSFFAKGLPALWRRTPDMNSLVALGASAAWAYSTVATFAPGLLPDTARYVYFEAAGVIVTLVLLGRFLEARAKGRTGAAIRRLVGLQPDTAQVEEGKKVVDRPLSVLQVGDVIRVAPGGRVPVDGRILTGSAHIDESMITGEPVPVLKGPGDTVTGGTVNGAGALRIEATGVGSDTVLAHIIRMVEAAQGTRLPIQNLVNRITLWFVPAVLVLALLTVAVWLAVGPAPALTHALVAGVSVLVIACPCAMGLATPTSIMVGTGRAAELGVLFRKGDALQELQSVRVVAFDKTGTLTEGKPVLTDLTLTEGQDRAHVLRLIGAVEAQSEHPIARAIEA